MEKLKKRQQHKIYIKCTGCRHNPNPKPGDLADGGGYPCNGCNTREILNGLEYWKAGIFGGNRYFTKEAQHQHLLEAPKSTYNNLTQINVDDLMEFYELNS